MLKFHIAILASSVTLAIAAKPQYQHGNGGIGHDGFNTTIGEDTHTRALDGSHSLVYGNDFAMPGWSLLDLSSRVYKTMTGSSTPASLVDGQSSASQTGEVNQSPVAKPPPGKLLRDGAAAPMSMIELNGWGPQQIQKHLKVLAKIRGTFVERGWPFPDPSWNEMGQLIGRVSWISEHASDNEIEERGIFQNGDIVVAHGDMAGIVTDVEGYKLAGNPHLVEVTFDRDFKPLTVLVDGLKRVMPGDVVVSADTVDDIVTSWFGRTFGKQWRTILSKSYDDYEAYIKEWRKTYEDTKQLTWKEYLHQIVAGQGINESELRGKYDGIPQTTSFPLTWEDYLASVLNSRLHTDMQEEYRKIRQMTWQAFREKFVAPMDPRWT